MGGSRSFGIVPGGGGGGGGDAPDATTTTKGIVRLAGDLTGTASTPTIAVGAVTSAKIANGTIVDIDVSGSAAIDQSKIDGLVDDLAAKATATRSIATTAPLTGGGDLSADRTLGVSAATTGAVGVVQLAGDLGGTATSPTVPGLADKAPAARSISTTAPLTGGGDLTADRTFAVSGATTGAVGVVQLAGDLGGTATAPTVPNKATKLTVTATKTTTYTAGANELIRADASAGGFTITLPAANVAGQVVAVRRLEHGGNTVTISRAGTDTIGGAPTLSLVTTNGVTLVSDGAGLWTIQVESQNLTALDGRYAQRGNNLSDLASASTARTNLGLGTSATRAVGTGVGTVLSPDAIDAKGDLLVGSAADTIVRVPVGADGLVLAADSTASAGVSYGLRAVPRRPALAGSWATITNRPLVIPGTGTGTLAKDSWRFLPIRLTEDLPVDALAVTTVTTAASGGTAALIFGLFALGADNRPGTRQTDYSSYGSIDLTQAVGILQLATVGLTIPLGEWYLGLAWSGTATTSPIMQTVTGHHPAISNVTATTLASAYLQSVSGATVPVSASVSTSSTTAPLVHGKIR
jgi:hypothetical protein